MRKIFISYNRKNEDFARFLCNDIEALGHTVLIDQKLFGGKEWWDQILEMIRECDLLAFVLSHETLNSTACIRECTYGAELGKPILPVLIEDNISTNILPPTLSLFQFVDYRDRDRNSVFQLAKALSSIPKNDLPEELPPPPEPPISYLGKITQQIDSDTVLDYNEQCSLIVDLKRSIHESEFLPDVETLLKRLRNRRDLYATIAEEIDKLLTEQSNNVVVNNNVTNKKYLKNSNNLINNQKSHSKATQSQIFDNLLMPLKFLERKVIQSTNFAKSILQSKNKILISFKSNRFNFFYYACLLTFGTILVSIFNTLFQQLLYNNEDAKFLITYNNYIYISFFLSIIILKNYFSISFKKLSIFTSYYFASVFIIKLTHYILYSIYKEFYISFYWSESIFYHFGESISFFLLSFFTLSGCLLFRFKNFSLKMKDIITLSILVALGIFVGEFTRRQIYDLLSHSYIIKAILCDFPISVMTITILLFFRRLKLLSLQSMILIPLFVKIGGTNGFIFTQLLDEYIGPVSSTYLENAAFIALYYFSFFTWTILGICKFYILDHRIKINIRIPLFKLNYRTLIYIFFVSTFIFGYIFVHSIIQNKRPTQKTAPTINSIECKPDWLESPPIDENLVYGTGEGKLRNSALTMEVADSRARSSILNTIRKNFEKHLFDIIPVLGLSKSEVSLLTSSLEKLLSREILNGCKIVKREICTDGKVYSLATWNKENLPQLQESLLKFVSELVSNDKIKIKNTIGLETFKVEINNLKIR